MFAARENLTLFAHQEARTVFLKSFHSDRFPPAWIVAGPFGIGKATFAFHMGRYILSNRQDGNTVFAQNDSLHHRIVAQSHADLFTLGGDEAPEIGIDPIRKLNSFLNQTPGEGGWRVIILDGADRLNRNGANALLKRLEEPPPKTVFFLITAFPGRLLPTIRSRCQLLPLSPLSEQEVKDVLYSQGFFPPDFLSLAQGSPGRLMRLMREEGINIYTGLQKILKGDSALSFVHTYGGEEASYALIEDLLRTFLYTHVVAKGKREASFFDGVSLDHALKVHEKIEELFEHCRVAQLDRKTTLLCVFAKLEKRTIK